MKRSWMIGLAAVLVVIALGAGVAAATGNAPALTGDDEAVTGTDAERAAQVAQDYVAGQGIDAQYSHVEAGDEDGVAYEVEFKAPNGEVEVQVDSEFQVVKSSTEGSDDQTESDDQGNAEDDQ